MIGNSYAYGRYSIIEEGEINRQTFELNVAHYLVCDAAGKQLDSCFDSLEAAQNFIDRQVDK